MHAFKDLIVISRPRFWIYLWGPYVLGVLANPYSVSLLHQAQSNMIFVIIFACYFLFPANLLLYGVNDIFDFETDKLNPKKHSYEQLLSPQNHRFLSLVIIVLTLPFAACAFFLPIVSTITLALFLLLSVFYSAPPIRFKGIPFLDSISNILYILPGVFGYSLMGNAPLHWSLLLAAALWVMAMHAYSAIPDIAADSKVHLNTVATFLGKTGCLTFCTLLYTGAALLAAPTLGILSYLLGVVYLVLMRKSYQCTTQAELLVLYKKFPMINTIVGFFLVLFCLVQALF